MSTLLRKSNNGVPCTQKRKLFLKKGQKEEVLEHRSNQYTPKKDTLANEPKADDKAPVVDLAPQNNMNVDTSKCSVT